MSSEAQMINYFKDVLRSSVYDMAIKTPLDVAKLLSHQFNNNIYFKREDKQIGSSFKIRGVYNKIKKISKTHKKLICASTGNLAYAVALVSLRFDCEAFVVMPKTTHHSKISKIEEIKGTHIILEGDDYRDSLEYAQNYANRHDCFFIDESDDPDVIIGNSSIAIEIVQSMGSEMSNVHAIFVPIGGGGLISAIAPCIKELYPKLKVIGVGIENSCALYESIKEDRPIELKKVNTFADSIAINKISTSTFQLCKQYIDEIILVTVDEICSAIKHIYEDTKNLVEPAGALSVAGLMKYIDGKHLMNETLIAILSGGNLNFDKLPFIAERARIGDKSEAILKITIPEEPNSLLELLTYIFNDCIVDDINISQFHYRYNDKKEASILVGFSMPNAIGTQSLIELIGNNYKIESFSDTTISSHIPFLIGGIHTKLSDEYIITFMLPERNGALMELLKCINGMINITMFHYRNTGDIYGHVLMGIQLINIKYKEFTNILDKITFISYTDETRTLSTF